jgi:hypothetical protein
MNKTTSIKQRKKKDNIFNHQQLKNIDNSNLCQNKQCTDNLKEIDKTNKLITYMEKELFLLDKEKADEFYEMSNRITKLTKKIDSMKKVIDSYQGINVSDLNYENLSEIEMNLMRLLMQVRHSISKIELAVINNVIQKPQDNSVLCKRCETNNINCLIHPCSHVALCIDCTIQSIRCPICNKFIEYYDKIYLPNMNE